MKEIIVTTPEELSAILDERIRLAFKHYVPQTLASAPKADAPPYVDKREAARLIGVCTSTIDNAARSGKLKRHYVGKAVRFERAQVLALAK